MRFVGKTAVVTGGASGIGRATALRLAQEGAAVWIGDIDEAGGGSLASESNGKISFRRTDVTKEDDIATLIDAAAASGRLDVVFNNAGAGGDIAPLDEIEAEGWDRTMALLLRSVALGIKHAARHMKGQGGGAIVNTASVAATGAGFAPSAYSIAKAGVLHLSKVAAADLAQYQIRVNAVLPGFITTNIFTSAIDVTGEQKVQADAMIAEMAKMAQPVARAGRPEDIAAAVAFLASEDAAFVNGTSLLVDGGLTIGERRSWDKSMPDLFEAIRALGA